MATRPATSLLFTLTAALSLTACSGGLDFGGSSSKKTGKGEGGDETAEPPGEITGTFLTCDSIEAEEIKPNEDTTPIGCTVRENDGKMSSKDRTFALTLHDGANKAVDMFTINASPTSAWHVLAGLPSGHAKDGILKMTVTKDGSSTAYTLPVSRLDTYKQLGTSVPLEGESESNEANGGQTSGFNLTNVPVHAEWQGGIIGFMVDGVAADDFCDQSGPLQQIGGASAALVQLTGKLFGTTSSIVPLNISAASRVITPTSGACFQKFKLIFSGGDGAHFAQINSPGTCLFIRTGTTLGIVDLQKIPESDRKNYTLENLRKFTSGLPCN